MIREYRTLYAIENSIVYAKGLRGIGYGEYAELVTPDGAMLPARVVSIEGDRVGLRVASDISGLDPANCRLRITGAAPTMSLSPDLLGRRIDGLGRICDGFSDIISYKRGPMYGAPIPLHLRKEPDVEMKTGIECIDSLPIKKGQRIAIYSSPEQSPIRLAYDIAAALHIPNGENDRIAVVLGAAETPEREIDALASYLMPQGRWDKCLIASSKASEKNEEKLSVPFAAVTAAEYLAFDLGKDVVLVISDMSRLSRLEGYDAEEWMRLLDRVGARRDKAGSVTLISVFTSLEYKKGVCAEALAFAASDRCLLLEGVSTDGEYTVTVCK